MEHIYISTISLYFMSEFLPTLGAKWFINVFYIYIIIIYIYISIYNSWNRDDQPKNWHVGPFCRWLTARERLAASGLAVSESQALLAGIGKPVPWKEDFAWHQRAGNGNQLQNIGIVILSALASLRPKPPAIVPQIQAPSFPDGLFVEDGIFKLKVGTSTFTVGNSKAVAVAAHRRVHAAWLPFISSFFTVGSVTASLINR